MSIPQETSALDMLGPRFVAPAAVPTAIALAAGPAARAAGIVPRLDRRAALAFLRDREYDFRRSFFTDVAMVEPLATVRRVDGVGLVIGPPPSAPPPRNSADVLACALDLRNALSDSVTSALTPAKRAAVTLSGGLDSSVVAAAAAAAWRHLQRPPTGLRFFHLLPPSGATEVSHARAVARHLGHALVEIMDGGGDPYLATHTLLAANDFPGDGGGPAAWAQVGSRMKREGVDAVLTGDGGDEAVGVAGETTSQSFGGVLGRLGLRARAILKRGYDKLAAGGLAPARGGPRGPGWLLDRARAAEDTVAAPAARRGLAGSAADRDRALRSGRESATLGWARAFDRIYGTRTTCPFLDPHVQDVVVSIPDLLFTVRQGPKGLLRFAFERELPPAQRDRPKDQPLWEPLFRTEFERFGAEWADKYVAGGALERDDIVTAPQALETFERAAKGSLDDLSLGLGLVGLAAWASARYL